MGSAEIKTDPVTLGKDVVCFSRENFIDFVCKYLLQGNDKGNSNAGACTLGSSYCVMETCPLCISNISVLSLN